jgi:PAS domain S-box-containing protein
MASYFVQTRLNWTFWDTRQRNMSAGMLPSFHADPLVIRDMLQKLSCGEKLDRYPARLRAKDGSIKHVLVTSNSRYEDGRFVNTRCFTLDVTHLYEAERARWESEGRLAATYEAATIGIAEVDEAGLLVRVNDAICKMLGRPREQLLNMRFLDYTHEDDRADDANGYHRQIAGEVGSYSIRKRARKPDGTIVRLDVYSSSVRAHTGEFLYAVRVLDINERKQAEKRQKSLVDELNHRVKNTLATVQSLSMQTARNSENLQDFSHRYEKRLIGLARAHDLLTMRHWQDAPLDLLVREVLVPIAGGSDRKLQVSGPSITLNSGVALSLTMVLNELMTNAAKYGALSSEGGRLVLTWQHEGPDQTVLALTWQERGGPPVPPPTRRGFGMQLIERCIERDLGGELDLAFEPDGLLCRMSFPWRERL